MYSTLKLLHSSEKNNPNRLLGGELSFHFENEKSKELIEYARNVVYEAFNGVPTLRGSSDDELKTFIERAKTAKNNFTNSSRTREILEGLIMTRYDISIGKLYYDVPRLRIIPNSSYLKSGISYNYLPHRDTWYGGGQEQINHWLPVLNVTEQSTFYIAPRFFFEAVPNNSEIFDLDVWDFSYRKMASASVRREGRPHPLPSKEISDADKLAIILPPGHEVCFSGHHLHGSLPNKTPDVRLSIDYRVSVPSLLNLAPKNVDCRAKGNYLKFMIEHPSF